MLETEFEGPVAVARLNRPEAMNALSTELCDSLIAFAAGLAERTDVTCVVVTGEGRAFCAGADLRERRRLGEAERWAYVENLNRAVRAIETIPVPVIGAVNGYTFGGGVEVALATDMRLAADTATFGLPEVALGIIPGGSIVRLLRAVPRSAAARLVYTGETVNADAARELSMVDEVVPAADLMERAMELARSIAKNAPLALRAAKELMVRSEYLPLEEAMRVAEEVRRPLDDTEDMLEGLAAFAERRAPNFKGR